MFIGDALYRGGRTPAQAGTAARTIAARCPALAWNRSATAPPPLHHRADQDRVTGPHPMKHTGLLFPAGAIALPGSASADADLSKLPPPSSQKGLTFEKDIQPLFEASCIGCHGENKQQGDLRLDSLAAVLKGGARTARSWSPRRARRERSSSPSRVSTRRRRCPPSADPAAIALSAVRAVRAVPRGARR